MLDAATLIEDGYDPDMAAKELMEDAQFIISDLAEDLRSQDRRLQDAFSGQEIPEIVWDAICAIKATVKHLDSAEDALVRYM
jgi:hypothetical protein